jgi:hypothetical protein
MPFKKIADLPKICHDPGHNPPGMIVLPDGVYEYSCPSCGRVTTFTVASPTLNGGCYVRSWKCDVSDVQRWTE